VRESLIADFIVKAPASRYSKLQTVRRVRRPLARLLRASACAAAVVFAIFFLTVAARAQEEEKPKIPGLDKIISAQEHLLFTGRVQSVDEKHNILSVNSEVGSDTEIFPIKHSTRVETADGFKKKLDVLSPGTRIMVYYDQRADHRTVTRIELFASESKKKEPRS
jgi:hypothetical protein